MTIKELIEELSKFPPETMVAAYGTDSGGYDSIQGFDVVVYQEGEGGSVYIKCGD